jgi:hypothetical protein
MIMALFPLLLGLWIIGSHRAMAKYAVRAWAKRGGTLREGPYALAFLVTGISFVIFGMRQLLKRYF